jgi:hypothetical protein
MLQNETDEEEVLFFYELSHLFNSEYLKLTELA